MPRQPRLDIPGLLQHVIVRGIERSEIFLDDGDRRRFVDRFDRLLVETETDCYAWALIPNHFHLLLRCNRMELSRFMRRLLTGYAVYFNLRHNRSGHLFQNRYKSIVCEEETYFLELIRYIHLNPLRAGLVSDLDELERYPWCGHQAILGNAHVSGHSVEAVLAHFGRQMDLSRDLYRRFVADGSGMGDQPHLVGKLSKRQESQTDAVVFDNRVLGSSGFIETLSEQNDLKGRLQDRKSLEELQRIIEDFFRVKPGGLGQRGRQDTISSARAVYCFLAVAKLRYSGVEVGKRLGICGSSVSRAARRGKELFQSKGDLQVLWAGC
ncbi:transposase of ISPca5, Y1_Tnp domain-containing [Syntrophotalea carbinolica DSM 2380]|uniref:Transposase of ISPca5, Y1_Tnp domain-containing n=1 Tax=Syntrophotalea carbinolica (strain DSM 2380 / NBRC 103641 / GraBd1) TaxID=338963 RepID=Q3A3M5_SYNC1|nr:transposase [Syntrophotalea carbinolica]ABA89032.1 transposase of ISPca5, Y1_Tnp domain-containing [Syntrophotalea carbinolica DSM 2380]